MKNNSFINNLVFRLIGPIITGSVIYLLILLINNNIDQILETFISDEYFVCLGLALLISESSRISLTSFHWLRSSTSPEISLLVIVLITSILSLLIVWLSLTIYYNYALGFSPNLDELQPFIILYTGLSLAYTSIYLSNFFIQKALTYKLENEAKLKEESKYSFMRLTKGINPDLLFESLETLITVIHRDRDAADDMIDDLSNVYRYTLSKNQTEIIDIYDELESLNSLVNLFNRLPYRTTQIKNNISRHAFVIPGTLLRLTESIIKGTIVSMHQDLILQFDLEEENICVSYQPHDRLIQNFTADQLKSLSETYKFYSDRKIEFTNTDDHRKICIPNLVLQNKTNEHTDHRG